MRQYVGLDQIELEGEDDLRGGAVSIGNFDGVHIGHQRILRELVRAARRWGGPAVVLTFDPSPAAVLMPHRQAGRLTPINERLRLLKRLGVDAAIVVRPDRRFLSQKPAEFVQRVFAEMLQARAVVEGTEWRFGEGRRGDVQLVGRLASRFGYELVAVEPVGISIKGGRPNKVSSTAIRWLLAAGEVEEAHKLLGRPYRLFGKVVRGSALGTKLGFPTVNLEIGGQMIPGDGIYAGRCHLRCRPIVAAIHVGPAPTVGRLARSVEAHLLGQVGEVYGEKVSLEFMQRLRDVQQFASTDEMAVQMQRDVAQVERLAQDWPAP